MFTAKGTFSHNFQKDQIFFPPSPRWKSSLLQHSCTQIRSIDSIDWIGSSPSSAAAEWLDKTRESRAKCRSLFIGSRIPAYRTPCRGFHANPTEYFSVIPTIPKPTGRVTFLLRSSSDLTRSSSSTRQQHPLGVYSRAAGARIKLLPSLVGSEITLPADKDLTWMIVDDISLKGSSKSTACTWSDIPGISSWLYHPSILFPSFWMISLDLYQILTYTNYFLTYSSSVNMYEISICIIIYFFLYYKK